MDRGLVGGREVAGDILPFCRLLGRTGTVPGGAEAVSGAGHARDGGECAMGEFLDECRVDVVFGGECGGDASYGMMAD